MKKFLQIFYIALILLFLYAPIFTLVLYSFVDTPIVSIEEAIRIGFSFELYKKLFADAALMQIVWDTLFLALIAAVLATVLGTVGSIGIYYSKGKLGKGVSAASRIPVINAEIVTAVALVLLFAFIFTESRSYFALVIGHLVITTPFVVLSVVPKLKQMDPNLYEAKYRERASRPKQESWLDQRAREREARRKEKEEAERRAAELLSLLQQEQATDSVKYNEALAIYNQGLAPQHRVGNGIKMYVVPKVALEMADDGTQEMNLKMEFTYETTLAENINLVYDKNTDDYPAGMYLPTQSKACKTTLNFIKEQLSGEMKKYFTPDTKVTIKITGETDGSTIRGKIPYKGEYGDIQHQMVYLNNSLDEISVTKKVGITSNAQLGFLRTQGVKSFLETYVDELQITKNAYQIYVVEREEKGSQYRRISVEFTIHNAYKKELAQIKRQSSQQTTIEETNDNNHNAKEDAVVDVDTNIPITKTVNEDTYVLIIANEHYNELVGIVPFAENDGTIFRQYCMQTLGIPERQIRMTIDATRNQIIDGLDWVENIAQARKGSAKFIVYYAGHGIPVAESTHILPTDANPEKINQLLSLNDIYVRLGNMPAHSVTFFIDACFSGTRRNGQPIVHGGRGLVKKANTGAINGNLIIFSAATTEQTAWPYPEKRHGLFTYFLLKALQTTNGTMSYEKLIAYLTEKVSLEASLQNRSQTPTMQYSEQIEDKLSSWTL